MSTAAAQKTEQTTAKPIDMKDIVALCKRRGFIFQSSEIYGGINGFYDYGPLGVELKNNIRDSWWRAMVTTPPLSQGEPINIVGLDSSIIQHPRSWEASGHVGGFNDPMVDDKETKKRYRADHVKVLVPKDGQGVSFAFDKEADDSEIDARLKKFAKNKTRGDYKVERLDKLPTAAFADILGPEAKKEGTLTEPRQFNMMFHTFVGAASGDDNKVYLRPETCGPIFLNFNNVVDTARVRVPFGIAQVGKAFRNEVTPRNFIFRTREFEQMELEWFCHESGVAYWFEFWLEQRKNWWRSIGLNLDNFYFNDIEKSELAHYSQRTVDFEYRFPFTAPGYGELEGIAHRGNFDLTQHEEFSGTKTEYMDPVTNAKFHPHVIEPSTGLTRAVLAVLCEAYTVDENRPSGLYLNFHPSIAPKKAAILPLTTKDGHPELATQLYLELRQDFAVDLDIKQNIGKRYARQDEIGTPFCFTIDNQSLEDKTVTVRARNTMAQERIAISKVRDFLFEKTRPIVL